MSERIRITDVDLTQPSTSLSSTDIVFVPGLSTNNTVGKGVPTLCTSLSDLKEKFGDNNGGPYRFTAEQKYPTGANQFTDAYKDKVMFVAESPDPGYIYAASLLSAGLQVVYCKLNDTDNDAPGIADAYTGLTALFADESLKSLGDINFKYITSGGYPTFEYNNNALVIAMNNLAASRGDCVALIDHTDLPDRELTGATSVFGAVNAAAQQIATNKSAMFTPWAYYTNVGGAYEVSMPASFGYLLSVAKTLATGTTYSAIAGVNRGLVPTIKKLHTNKVLTNAIADTYQSYSSETYNMAINAITNIKPYGLCIWGNRTLENVASGTKALSYLHIVALVCDVKKTVYDACVALMYEQNNAALWANFKGKVTTLLDKIVSLGALATYKIVKNDNGSRTKVSATIKLYPVYAVESFDVSVQITDDTVEVN